MVKGRNTFVVSIRLPDAIKPKLEQMAGDMTIGEYLKKQVLRACEKKKDKEN